MLANVETIFPKLTERLEGKVSWMYLDILGLCTTGCGNLLADAGAPRTCTQEALSLPWKAQGFLVSQEDVKAAYAAITADGEAQAARPDNAKRAAGFYTSISSLRLDDDAIDALVDSKAREIDKYYSYAYQGWEDFPADVQLALMLMAWAEGARGVKWRFPRFNSALSAADWRCCAAESHMDDSHNPGLRPRNDICRHLFEAAQAHPAEPAVVHLG